MRRLFPIGATACLLVAVGSIAWAATSFNSSKSNIYRAVFDVTVATPQQVDSTLADLDKMGTGPVDGATLRKVLQKHGVQVGKINKITILPAGGTQGLHTILLLTNPADEAQARHIAVSDSLPQPVVRPK